MSGLPILFKRQDEDVMRIGGENGHGEYEVVASTKKILIIISSENPENEEF